MCGPGRVGRYRIPVPVAMWPRVIVMFVRRASDSLTHVRPVARAVGCLCVCGIRPQRAGSAHSGRRGSVCVCVYLVCRVCAVSTVSVVFGALGVVHRLYV